MIYEVFGIQGKYPVVTLCGTTRFKDAFMEVQRRLTLEGQYYYHCKFVLVLR